MNNTELSRLLVHELVERLDIHEVIALGMVINEMSMAKDQHPEWPTDQVYAAAIVAEEAGELVQAALSAHYKGEPLVHTRTEAMHTAVAAIRFMVNHPVEVPRRPELPDRQ